jgi:hypothetical protein
MKLDVREWLTVVSTLSIAPSPLDHLRRHIDADGSTGWPDLSGGQENIQPTTRT